MEEIPEELSSVRRKNWIYLLRQLMVVSGVWATYFLVGQFIGAPTVFVPQLRKDPTMRLDDELASWMYSLFGYCASPWVILLSVLNRRFGLRLPHAIACVNLLVVYTVLYLSKTPLQILTSQIMLGFSHACVMTTGILIISEYSSPKYRGVFLSIKATNMLGGIISSNTIGTFFHWKRIAYTGFLCSAYTLTFVFWPESPQWLASRGRFDDCRKAYYWLQGRNEKTEREVEKLIASRVNAGKVARLNDDWRSLPNAFRTVTSKEFYAPMLLIALLAFQFHLAGKNVCTIYVLEILKKMTANEWTAYMGMLILDFVTLFSMYIGCFLVKILNRRTLYLTTTVIGLSFLLIISLYLYLVKLKVLSESEVISIVLLTFFSVAMGCGPMVMNMSLYAELIPLRFRSVMALLSALFFFTTGSSMLRLAPFIFKKLEMHGAFLFFGLSSGLCTLLLYKYLPETKDKTLQEIEDNFKEKQTESEMERFQS